MVLALVVIGYCYIFVDWLICLVTTCIFIVFCVFYFSQERERRADALR